jgi:hypothetical protein
MSSVAPAQWGELAGEERGRRAYRHPGAPAATSDSTSGLLEVQWRERAYVAVGIHLTVARKCGAFGTRRPCAGFSPHVPGSYSFVAEGKEQRTEERIQVREVTHVQASWTEQDRGGDGAFTLQLILDNGADEYVLRPTADDAEVLLKLFKRADSAMFDLERKVVIFNNLAIE